MGGGVRGAGEGTTRGGGYEVLLGQGHGADLLGEVSPPGGVVFW